MALSVKVSACLHSMQKANPEHEFHAFTLVSPCIIVFASFLVKILAIYFAVEIFHVSRRERLSLTSCILTLSMECVH